MEIFAYFLIGSGTDPVSLNILFFLLLFGRHTSDPLSFQIATKFGRIILQVNNASISDTTSYFQDGGHDVISCIKVLPSG